MDFPLHTLHANRHPIERRNLLPLIHARDGADKFRPDNGTDEERARYYEEHVKPLENEIIAAFPKEMTEREIFEIVLREEHWEQTITGWQDYGAAIFSFAPELVSKLDRTDVWDLPIQSIRLPYERLYVSVPGGFLPHFNDEFEIDGIYLTSERFLPQRLKEGFTTEAAIVADAKSDRRRIGEVGMARVYEVYGAHSFDDYVRRRLEENVKARNSFESFNEDPDEWYATVGKGSWSPYWMLFVDFTFRSTSRRVGPWTTEYIAREPILRADYTFPNHRSTVRDAVADAQANGLPTETFVEDVEHPNDFRNVVSSPEYLEEVTRLVFNVVCYLNWPERDETKHLNDASAQIRNDRSPSKAKRQKAQSRALKEGFRLIYFCGYGEEEAPKPAGSAGKTVASHWRRGHWRNQRYGKGFSDTKLLWIAPTLVKAAENSGDVVTTVYQTGNKHPSG